MFPAPGVAGGSLGQQVGSQDSGINVSPMSPMRAKEGCGGVPVPPSSPSSGSRQQQTGRQQFVNCRMLFQAQLELVQVLVWQSEMV